MRLEGLQILEGPCRKNKDGMEFCLRLSLSRGGCLRRVRAGIVSGRGLRLQ